MEYFDFYNMPVSFELEEEELKLLFLQKSREYHPDFYTLASEEKKAEILLLSSKNNEAFKTLNDFDLRMKYILGQKEILKGEGQDKLDQMFLMEMMDINEAIMEVQMDPDPKEKEKIIGEVEKIDASIYESIVAILKKPFEEISEKEFEEIKQYYLKKKYLIRIRENLKAS